MYDGSLHPSKLFCSHRKSSNSCTVSWYFQWTFFKKAGTDIEALKASNCPSLQIQTPQNSHLTCCCCEAEGLQRQQGVWCDVDEGIASSISQGATRELRDFEWFLLITLASDPPGVLGYGEEESVPYTKDQFMRGWPVTLKQQSKVLSRNPSWFRKVSHEERFEIHLKHPQDVLRTRQWAIPFRLDVSLEGFVSAPMMTWSWRKWFGKSILHGCRYLYYDTCLFICLLKWPKKTSNFKCFVSKSDVPNPSISELHW